MRRHVNKVSLLEKLITSHDCMDTGTQPTSKTRDDLIRSTSSISIAPKGLWPLILWRRAPPQLYTRRQAEVADILAEPLVKGERELVESIHVLELLELDEFVCGRGGEAVEGVYEE